MKVPRPRPRPGPGRIGRQAPPVRKVIEAEFRGLPPDVMLEIRSWPSIADTIACDRCPECTAQENGLGGAVCVLARPLDGDRGEDEPEAARVAGPAPPGPRDVIPFPSG